MISCRVSYNPMEPERNVINPRFDIPFEGSMHNALSDARHQVKYVSAIWQRLTKN
ncbi:hypothetical protein B5P53_11960 [Citrobacter portucalensis]|nr:hypothetical protein B5P53_11960 [Citrobacter portucalensis]